MYFDVEATLEIECIPKQQKNDHPTKGLLLNLPDPVTDNVCQCNPILAKIN